MFSPVREKTRLVTTCLYVCATLGPYHEDKMFSQEEKSKPTKWRTFYSSSRGY